MNELGDDDNDADGHGFLFGADTENDSLLVPSDLLETIDIPPVVEIVADMPK